MYQLQMKRLRMLILFIGITLTVFAAFYIATHGRITVTNKSDEIISVVQINKDQTLGKIVDIKNGAILKSGNYVVQNNVSGAQRVGQISIPGWLQGKILAYDTLSNVSVNRSAALTYENYFKTSTGELVSFTNLNDYISGYTLHNPTDAFGGKYTDIPLEEDIYSPVITKNGTIIGVVDGSISEYNVATKQFTSIKTIETEVRSDVTSAIRLQRSKNIESGAYGVYEGTEKRLNVLGIENTQTYKDIDFGNRNAVYDVNDIGWVRVKNTEENKDKAKLEEEEKKLPYSLDLYSYKSKDQKRINIGSASQVGSVALSGDSKYIAVEKDSQLWVYDANTGQVIMVNAFTNTNKIFWYNNKLYSLSTDQGLSVFNPKNNQILSLGTSGDDNLSFSNAVPLGSMIYFTAFSRGTSTKLPDGYVIDLENKGSSFSKELTQKLPFSSNQYDIGYLGSVIYVRINYFNRSGDTPEALATVEKIKSLATQKLNSLLSKETLKNTTIVFNR